MEEASEWEEEGGELLVAGATVEVEEALLRPKPVKGPKWVSFSSVLTISTLI